MRHLYSAYKIMAILTLQLVQFNNMCMETLNVEVIRN